MPAHAFQRIVQVIADDEQDVGAALFFSADQVLYHQYSYDYCC
jgi:hypothetical protein